MKKSVLLLPLLIAGFGFVSEGWMAAQSFRTLHSFTPLNNNTNRDGANPYAGLVLLGNKVYGATYFGGSAGNGTVFAVNSDGTGFTNLHSFTELTNDSNYDGSWPEAGLTSSGDTLYGTAYGGGSSYAGTVFAVNTNGTGFTNLHSFTAPSVPFNTNSDGASPRAGLILSGSTLYGAAIGGGSSGKGAIFALNTNGKDFTNLHSFTGTDGANPSAGLILSGNTLYGTAQSGSPAFNGTVFKVNTDGTDFVTLHTFSTPPFATNSDGAGPFAGLILSGDTLYGTAYYGGISGKGAIFALNTNGTDFTNPHSVTALSGVLNTNSDGANPSAGLVLWGSTLYGTMTSGGSSGEGVILALNTNGTGFSTLHNFTKRNNSNTNSDGASPSAGLVLSGHTLYGTARWGGNSGNGTVFSFSLPLPQLAINPFGANVVLTWPTNAAGFTLQTAPAINGTFTNLPGATSPYTNPTAGAQQFFRLISN